MDDFWEAVGVRNSEGRGGGGRPVANAHCCHNLDINLITRPRLTFKFVCFFGRATYILPRISVNPVPR